MPALSSSSLSAFITNKTYPVKSQTYLSLKFQQVKAINIALSKSYWPCYPNGLTLLYGSNSQWGSLNAQQNDTMA